MKAVILINRQTIAKNAKMGTNEAPIIVRTYKGPKYAHAVRVNGPMLLKHSPKKPLKCGARVWIECNNNDVEIVE